MSNRLEFIPIQLPGREKKFLEPLATSVDDVIDDLVEEVISQIDKAKPTVIFGHSLGAILAYELTQKLIQRSDTAVCALVVSGSPGPWNLRTRKATGLPDVEFIETIQEFANFSHVAMADSAMLDLILPILRADVQMHEEYKPAHSSPMPVPIFTIRGSEDSLVSVEDATTWSKATTLPLEYRVFKGGHMYLVDQADKLVSLIEEVTEYSAVPEVS